VCRSAMFREELPDWAALVLAVLFVCFTVQFAMFFCARPAVLQSVEQSTARKMVGPGSKTSILGQLSTICSSDPKLTVISFLKVFAFALQVVGQPVR